MAVTSTYITQDALESILATLNIDGYQDADKQDLLDRAAGDLESALCERFVVPLVCTDGSAFSSAPAFTKQKVANAMRAKVRSIIALDKHNNTTIETTEKFINVHEREFDEHVKALLDAKKKYGLKLDEQAVGAVEPLQSIGIARADNDLEIDGCHIT